MVFFTWDGLEAGAEGSIGRASRGLGAYRGLVNLVSEVVSDECGHIKPSVLGMRIIRYAIGCEPIEGTQVFVLLAARAERRKAEFSQNSIESFVFTEGEVVGHKLNRVIKRICYIDVGHNESLCNIEVRELLDEAMLYLLAQLHAAIVESLHVSVHAVVTFARDYAKTEAIAGHDVQDVIHEQVYNHAQGDCLASVIALNNNHVSQRILKLLAHFCFLHCMWHDVACYSIHAET